MFFDFREFAINTAKVPLKDSKSVLIHDLKGSRILRRLSKTVN